METAQEEYWRLAGEWARATAALEIANDNLHNFLQQHQDETFKVFDPKAIRATLREDVESWDL